MNNKMGPKIRCKWVDFPPINGLIHGFHWGFEKKQTFGGFITVLIPFMTCDGPHPVQETLIPKLLDLNLRGFWGGGWIPLQNPPICGDLH